MKRAEGCAQSSRTAACQWKRALGSGGTGARSEDARQRLLLGDASTIERDCDAGHWLSRAPGLQRYHSGAGIPPCMGVIARHTFQA